MKGLAVAVAAVSILFGSARAGAEEEKEEPPALSGFARAGWRIVSDEGEGRYGQDEDLDDGPRLFDLGLDWLAAAERWVVDEAEFRASGIGDPGTDASLTLRRTGEAVLEAGYRRDDFSYLATGDPYPWETRRARSFLRARYSPGNRSSLRASWNRDVRRGHSPNLAFTRDIEGLPSGEAVPARRPLDRTFDDFALGGDLGAGPFRFGLTQAVRLGSVDEARLLSFDGTGTPASEVLRQDARSKAFSTVAKAGVSLLGGAVDLGLITTVTRQSLASRLSGEKAGFSNLVVEGGVEGAYEAVLSGANRHRRGIRAHRLEASVEVTEDLELLIGAEWERSADRVELRLDERRAFERADLADRELATRAEGTVSYREARASADAVYDLMEGVRIRLAEEWYSERLVSPLDTRGGSADPTEWRNRTFRHTAGVDLTPSKRLSISVLGRYSAASEPHVTPGAERAEEASVRARLRVAEATSLACVYRRKAFHHDSLRSSNSRVESVSISADHGGDTLAATVSLTFQAIRNRAGTSWYDFDVSPAGPIVDAVEYRSRATILAGQVRWSMAPELRFLLSGSLARNDGDAPFLAAGGALRGEVDLRREMTFGITLRGRLYDERRARVDDYSVTALEVDLTLRF